MFRLTTARVLVLVGLTACGGEVGDGADGGDRAVDARGAADARGVAVVDAASGPVRLAHGASVPITDGQNFPDPGLYLAGGRAYRFSTNGGGRRVPMASADQPEGPWSSLSDAFPGSAPWVLDHIWAPEVHAIAGRSYLYYAATVAFDGSAFGEHALGVAESDGPDGPYVAIGTTPLHRDPAGRGVIDPEIAEIDGRRWLVYSTDWGPDGRTSGIVRSIQARELDGPDTLVGPVIELLTARAGGWERGTVEAPSLIMGPDGRLHLLYSGGDFESAYATGYAICPRDLGPCVRASDAPWLAASPPNPGGLDVVVADDGSLIGLHHGGPVSLRQPYVLPLSWE